MAREVERKFLVDGARWRPDPARGMPFRQGYLSSHPGRVVRVRVAGGQAFLTIKGPTHGITRLEFEYDVPVADGEAMLRLCERPLIEKLRYRETWDNRTWEIDVFGGENTGLVLAEVELPSDTAQISLPPWAGQEVSDDPRYFNSNLVRLPFARWRKS